MSYPHTPAPRTRGTANVTAALQPTESQAVAAAGRRQFGQWALASAGLLALAACGGGSGSGSSDSGSSGRVDLYWAFDQLSEGMSPEDVERIVGAPANAVRTRSTHAWLYGVQRLNVGYASPSHSIIVNAQIVTIDSSRPSLERVFPV